MKYNPDNKDLTKGKQTAKAGYHKGTFLDEDGVVKMTEIMQNGGQSMVLSQGKLDTGVEFIELKIYFAPTNKEL